MDLEARPIGGRNTITLHNVDEDGLERGSEPKSVINASVRVGERTRPVSFIERYTPFPSTWIQNWQMMREAGLPVPPTVRETDRQTIVVTNLKAHGEEMYGKGMLIHLREAMTWDDDYKLTAVDHIFLDLIQFHETDIIAEANRIVNIANRQLICLPTDDAMELLVEPSGSWRIVIADLVQAYRGIDAMGVMEQNESSRSVFVERLQRCARELRRLSTASTIPPQPASLRARIVQALRSK